MADLPSLNALKAFDAAARHKSFTRAAEELHVTHGAVSRLVKELEDYLGWPVFERRPRGLELTATGRQLAYTTGRVFDELRRTVADLRINERRRNVITVSTVSSLAARWLVPRIAAYQAQHAGTEIRIATSKYLADFRRDGVDVALRYGRGPWPGTYSERLFDSSVFPVCAPGLLEGEYALRAPRDLKAFTLLHDMSYTNWVEWLERAGVTDVNARAGLVLEDSNVLLQAAIEGQGVALASLPLVQADLRARRLVRPFDMTVPVETAFHIVCETGRESDSLLGPFIAWLREQASLASTFP